MLLNFGLEEVVKSIEDKFGEILLTVVVAGLSYAWTSAKGWFQQGNTRDKQLALSLEAERLLKLRETLANAPNPSQSVTAAQAAIARQLNHVLENLSQSLSVSGESTGHSRSVTVIGKYLLLYRAFGIVSNLLHWIFYLLVMLWLLISVAGFTVNDWRTNLGVCAVLLIPVVVWNYLTRKVDDWLRRRQIAAPVLAKANAAN